MIANDPQRGTDAPGNRVPFLRYYFLRRPLWNNPFLLVLSISLLVLLFENSRIFVEMQSWSLDLYWAISRTFSHCVHPSPVISNDIYIVSITNSDYRNQDLFDSQSPLKSEKVKELLAAVLRLGPKVVGVDLDTKDPREWSKVVNSYCKGNLLKGVPAEIFPENNIIVVWARMPVEGRGKEVTNYSGDRRIQLYQVLGGCAGDKLDEFSGVPRFPLDADGVVRRYVGAFPVDGELKNGNPPTVGSFARVVAEKSGGRLRSGTKERILNFGHKKCFQKIASGSLVGIAEEKDDKENQCPTSDEEWKQNVGIGNRIVLIGGEFEDARDTHDTTPAQVSLPQPISGVELNAMAIDSYINGGAITIAPRWVVFLVDLLVAGPLFVWIFFEVDHHQPRPTIMLFVAATAVTFLIAIGVSWGLLLAASIWISFIPILIGANIHQYLRHAEMIGARKANTEGAA